MFFAVASGVCAAFNGVFAKLYVVSHPWLIVYRGDIYNIPMYISVYIIMNLRIPNMSKCLYINLNCCF
jgi:hypothetical protein